MADDPKQPAPEALLHDIIAIVSHDLRTPLSVMQTTASMLLNPKYNLSPQQVREQHERIRRNVDVMNRMIGDVVDVVSLRSGALSIDPTPVALDDLLREAVAAHEAPAHDLEIALAYESGGETLEADGDRVRLLQLFRNLIGSALKSCKAGDRIDVASRKCDGGAEISIVDSGPGVAAADLPHVFDPYYPAGNKHLKSGTRLDLYIGKGIVEAHAGQIRCESTPGSGTTYRIRLPLKA
jgi:signal transduction histidine kinase